MNLSPHGRCRGPAGRGVARVGGPCGDLCPGPTRSPTAAEAQAPGVAANLKVFDTLDFDVFSNLKWDRLGESHAEDIVVTWPDGHEIRGIEKHIEDLWALFVFVPDITISEHPIRFGAGAWTTAAGVVKGTFSQPMPVGDGKTIAPTGRSFAIGRATVALRTDGKMDHGWLFRDNSDSMKQIGLAG